MSIYRHTYNPPLPANALNGWGPNYPIGMTDVDLLLFSPTVYDLYRTNGGMGSGMVDYFQYDPITQYGNLSSSVATGLGSSDLWFAMMNHKRPYTNYPFTSVQNSESNYNQPQKQLNMGIEEMSGTGFFRSLNEESKLTTTVGQSRGSSTSPSMLSTTTPPPTNTTPPKTCPAGQQLVYNKCIPIRATSGTTLPPTSTVSSGQPGASPTVVVVNTPVAPVPMMTGGGGGGGAMAEAPAETSEKTDIPEKKSYTIPLILAVIGAGAGYYYAKKKGKKIAIYAAIGFVAGVIAGFAYTKFKK